MESQEVSEFRITGNKFHDIDSEFILQNTLNTAANQYSPCYALLSLTSDDDSKKILSLKSSLNVTLAQFIDDQFKDNEKLSFENGHFLEQSYINTFTFTKNKFGPGDPPTLVIGYRTGIVVHGNCEKKALGFYNFDEKNKKTCTHKFKAVSLLEMVPDTNGEEVLAVFEDSTMQKYTLSSTEQDVNFIEKLKRFEQKTSFKAHLNKFKHTKKKKNNWCYGSYIKENTPELNYFYAHNDQNQAQNPRSFLKFNHRTISDLAIRKHPAFVKSLNSGSNSKDMDMTVLAFVSLDGYLVIYDFITMEPRLSYKSNFGGLNSLSFSEDCELVALGGQDDCITVLDLNNMKTLRCEGHKSFVSRAIFQTISTGDNYIGSKDRSVQRYRIIGGGMDGCLSFWEFDKQPEKEKEKVKQGIIFGSKKSDLPVRLSQINMTDSIVLKPTLMVVLKNAIGTLEICGKLLFVSDYGGAVTIYSIKNIIPVPIQKEDNSLLKLEGSRDETLAKMREWRAQRRQEDKEKETPSNNGGSTSSLRNNYQGSLKNNYQGESGDNDKYSSYMKTQPGGSERETSSHSSLSSALRDVSRKRTDSGTGGSAGYEAGYRGGDYGRR